MIGSLLAALGFGYVLYYAWWVIVLLLVVLYGHGWIVKLLHPVRRAPSPVVWRGAENTSQARWSDRR
jgi:hypothetical protein